MYVSCAAPLEGGVWPRGSPWLGTLGWEAENRIYISTYNHQSRNVQIGLVCFDFCYSFEGHTKTVYHIAPSCVQL